MQLQGQKFAARIWVAPLKHQPKNLSLACWVQLEVDFFVREVCFFTFVSLQKEALPQGGLLISKWPTCMPLAVERPTTVGRGPFTVEEKMFLEHFHFREEECSLANGVFITV